MITKKYLTPNPYSRAQWPMYDQLGVVIHGTGNPGSTARDNWAYFEHDVPRLKKKVSCHFIVDPDECLQLMPITEEAFHLRYPRADSPYKEGIEELFGNNPSKTLVGIEMCHPDASGRPAEATLWRTAALCFALWREKGLDVFKHFVRHFDVTGKRCPAWFVEHPGDWMQFKIRIKEFVVNHERFEHQRIHAL